ncbi:MAG: hypothetical protein ABI893_08515 [Polaromonas sp.]|uniref:hypothetical protein n=1 Tax=Polaromonas sp. TaxID=1869339 RepID=UPI003264C648
MGIISFSHVPMLSGLLAPVHALVSLFVPASGMAGAGRCTASANTRLGGRQLALPFSSDDGAVTHGSTTHVFGGPSPRSSAKLSLPSRLRVVREFDSNVSPACAGRMVISGRMADVCAELERMSQREASAQ